MNLTVEDAQFEDVAHYWETYLWKDSAPKAMSSLTSNLEYDLNIYDNYSPSFWCIKFDNKIIGALSGHKTSKSEYRTRGLYIDEKYRRKGLALKLIEAAKLQAKKEECNIVWTLPRKSAIDFYKAAGFSKTSDWFDEKMQYGPNCIAKLSLD